MSFERHVSFVIRTAMGGLIEITYHSRKEFSCRCEKLRTAAKREHCKLGSRPQLLTERDLITDRQK